MVESVRVGTVIAHDRKAANQWKSRRTSARRRGRKVSQAGLESAIASLAVTNPEYVVVD